MDFLNKKIILTISSIIAVLVLTIGITFAFFEVNILKAVLMIGIVTFILSILGVIIGNKFGNKYEKKAQILGGTILICLGIKNLLEHFSVI